MTVRRAITRFLSFQDQRLAEESWWGAHRLIWLLFSFRGCIGRSLYWGTLYSLSVALGAAFVGMSMVLSFIQIDSALPQKARFAQLQRFKSTIHG